ncbi:MAG: mechanosensitive ion channel family protein [Parvibaculaceae bacterium]
MDTEIVRAAQNSLGALQAAIDSASALIVAYAFSFAGALIVLAVGMLTAGIAERWVRGGLARIRGIDQTIVGFMATAVKYAVLVLVLVTVLAQFGVQTTSIIAALGAAGLAIGLALQGTLQNIAAGLMILMLKPFRVGESITAGAVSGTVREIGLFTTEFETAEGVYLMAPNSALWNTPIVNFSRNGKRRLELEKVVDESEDVAAVRRRLLEIARADTRVLPLPAPLAYVKKTADGDIAVVLRTWARTGDHFALSDDLTLGLRETGALRTAS